MPQRIYYEEPYEQAVREEGERLMDMYDIGSTPYLLGVAILRVLTEKQIAERRVRSTEGNLTQRAADECKTHAANVHLGFKFCPDCGNPLSTHR